MKSKNPKEKTRRLSKTKSTAGHVPSPSRANRVIEMIHYDEGRSSPAEDREREGSLHELSKSLPRLDSSTACRPSNFITRTHEGFEGTPTNLKTN